MLDDSAQALETKDRFRQGETSFADFSRTMDELRRTGKDRTEPKKPTTGPGKSRFTVAASAAGLAVSTSSVSDGWGSRDNPIEGRGKGGGTTTGLKRPVSSSGVLSKLGERLSGFTSSSNTGQVNSPALDRTSSGTSGGRRKSPRRGFRSPRQYAGSEPSGGGTGGGWHPWSTSRSVSAGLGPLDGRGGSPNNTPVRGVTGLDQSGGDGSERARREGSTFASQPLTGSEIDNMSSISNTSTMVNDLSSRVQKLEESLARWSDEYKYPRRRRHGGHGSTASRRARLESASSPDSGGGSGSGGSEPSSNTNDSSVDVDMLSWQQDTETQLKEVRGRLRQLTEIEGGAVTAPEARSVSAPADAAAVAEGPRVAPALFVAAPRPLSSTLTEGKSGQFSAAVITGSAVGGVSGGNNLRGGMPASELPAGNDDDDAVEGLKPAASPSQPGASASGIPTTDQDGSTIAGPKSGPNPRGFEREGKGEGEENDAGGAAENAEGGRKEDASDDGGGEVRDMVLDNALGDRESSVGVLRRDRPTRLSTITEVAP